MRLFILFLTVSCWAQDLVAQKTAIEYRRTLGQIQDNRINEASGLVASNLHDGILWTHNDSGDSARIFAIDTLGVTRYVLNLEGIEARDWEDLAIGLIDSVSYLFVGDIGDNGRVRTEYQIHRVAEPIDLSNQSGSIDDVKTIRFTYDEGPQNAETLIYDESDHSLVIANKGSTLVSLFSLPAKFDSTAVVEMKKFASLEFPNIGFGSKEFQGLVGGDFRGDLGILKTYSGLFVTEKDTMSVRELPYVMEPQGEAVAIAKDLAGYYTLSEVRNGVPATLYYYPLSDSITEKWASRKLNPISDYKMIMGKDGRENKLALTLDTDDSIQIFLSDTNGIPLKIMYDGQVRKDEAFSLTFRTDNMKNGVYTLFIVGENFTKQEEIRVN